MTQAQRNAIRKASVYLPQDAKRLVGRYVALDVVLKIAGQPKKGKR